KSARFDRPGPSPRWRRQGGDPFSGGTRSAPSPICFVRSGDAGQGYRPLSGGRVPHRGSTLIRSLPPDLSHRIGDAAGALTAFTSSKFDLRGPRSSPALALRELSFSTTEELEPQ